MSRRKFQNKAASNAEKGGLFMFMSGGSEPLFHHQKKEPPLPLPIIKQARQSGQLNLSNRGMIEVPDIVWHLNCLTLEERQSLTLSMDSTQDDRWWDQADLTKLILASNRLRSLSSEINNHPSLTVLDVHDNQISNLPDSIQDLRLLTKLNLSHNCLQKLPPCIYQLRELRQLLVQHNSLEELDDNIGNLSFLEQLDLSQNKLKDLPHTIGFLTRLCVLNVANNELTSLPLEAGDLVALRRLELTHNELTSLPDSIGLLSHLEQIYVQHNKLPSLCLFDRCPLLKEIHAGNNCISQISPEFVESLVSIKILDFRDNKISELPDNITWLQVLERLDLTNNNLSSLPYTLGTLPHLKSLSIEGNPMRSIRRDIIQRGTVQLLRWLRSRIEDPSKTGLPRSRPSSADMDSARDGNPVVVDKFMLRSTRTLNYSNKGAISVPKELFEVAAESEVNIVDLSQNALSCVPDSLNLLTPKISELNLSFNKLASLPIFMGLCSHLSFLDLRNNQLQVLPSELSNLQDLREINISFNRFHHLPGVLYHLTKLEIIFASDNCIQDIDVCGLSSLRVLATLDLQNNDIGQVPPELGHLTQLRSLKLEGNPFRNPRPAILTKGTASLLEYLRDRIPT